MNADSHSADEPQGFVSSSAMERLLRLAAESVRRAVMGETLETPCPDDAEMQVEGGVFVTLRHEGRLAGCIGYVTAPPPLWDTVVNAARAATLDDPRFTSPDVDQLGRLDVELSLLSPMEPISADEIEIGRHGLVLEHGFSRALLLPQVAVEHGLDRHAFLEALCQKGQLAPGSWREPQAQLLGFTVQKRSGSLLALCAGEDDNVS